MVDRIAFWTSRLRIVPCSFRLRTFASCGSLAFEHNVFNIFSKLYANHNVKKELHDLPGRKPADPDFTGPALRRCSRGASEWRVAGIPCPAS
jgi:hypothetical protein